MHKHFQMIKIHCRAEDVAQWFSVCSAYMKPWVQCPVRQKTNQRTKFIVPLRTENHISFHS
jgi:hypothetical protein